MEDNYSTSEEYEIIESESSSPTLTTNMITAPESELAANKVSQSFITQNDDVSTEPMLNIANNGNIEDLENQLKEVYLIFIYLSK